MMIESSMTPVNMLVEEVVLRKMLVNNRMIGSKVEVGVVLRKMLVNMVVGVVEVV